MNDYLRGTMARAKKEPWPVIKISDQWEKGYKDMEKLLSPIETDIVLLGLKYSTTVSARISELLAEEQARAGVAEGATSCTGTTQ